VNVSGREVNIIHQACTTVPDADIASTREGGVQRCFTMRHIVPHQHGVSVSEPTLQTHGGGQRDFSGGMPKPLADIYAQVEGTAYDTFLRLLHKWALGDGHLEKPIVDLNKTAQSASKQPEYSSRCLQAIEITDQQMSELKAKWDKKLQDCVRVNALHAKILLNGNRHLAFMDTGSSISIITPELCAYYAIKIYQDTNISFGSIEGDLRCKALGQTEPITIAVRDKHITKRLVVFQFAEECGLLLGLQDMQQLGMLMTTLAPRWPDEQPDPETMPERAQLQTEGSLYNWKDFPKLRQAQEANIALPAGSKCTHPQALVHINIKE